MDTNFSHFIEPITPDQLAGSNIEYDTRFINLQGLAEGKPEQQYGDIIIEAEDPDWNSIEKLCRQLLSESKDIRVFCYYIQALTANYGLVGLKAGFEILHKNLELYWEKIYPLLHDEDDEYDPFYRINSIGLLLSENGILTQLNNSKIFGDNSKYSQLLVKQAVSIIVNNESEIYHGGREKLLQDMKVAFEAGSEELKAIWDSLNIIDSIETQFNKNIEDHFLDFSIIKKPLQIITEHISEIKNNNDDLAYSSSVQQQRDSNTDSGKVLNLQTTFDLSGFKISNRTEVNLILEKLILYFRLKEPSHPAPLFIGRLQKLMDMDFYEIMQEISPNSITDLDNIIGKKVEDGFEQDTN